MLTTWFLTTQGPFLCTDRHDSCSLHGSLTTQGPFLCTDRHDSCSLHGSLTTQGPFLCTDRHDSCSLHGFWSTQGPFLCTDRHDSSSLHGCLTTQGLWMGCHACLCVIICLAEPSKAADTDMQVPAVRLCHFRVQNVSEAKQSSLMGPDHMHE